MPLREIIEAKHPNLFSRVVSASEIPNRFANHINTAYACMAGTGKHTHLTFSDVKHVDAAIAMTDLVLGGEGRHLERPFCSSGGCPAASPLTLAGSRADAQRIPENELPAGSRCLTEKTQGG